jgi:hypothetical protein
MTETFAKPRRLETVLWHLDHPAASKALYQQLQGQLLSHSSHQKLRIQNTIPGKCFYSTACTQQRIEVTVSVAGISMKECDNSVVQYCVELAGHC